MSGEAPQKSVESLLFATSAYVAPHAKRGVMVTVELRLRQSIYRIYFTPAKDDPMMLKRLRPEDPQDRTPSFDKPIFDAVLREGKAALIKYRLQNR